MSRHLYVPWQVPALHAGVTPEQAALGPHLHTPFSHVSVLPVQSGLSVHSAIEETLKYNYKRNVLK